MYVPPARLTKQIWFVWRAVSTTGTRSGGGGGVGEGEEGGVGVDVGVGVGGVGEETGVDGVGIRGVEVVEIEMGAGEGSWVALAAVGELEPPRSPYLRR